MEKKQASSSPILLRYLSQFEANPNSQVFAPLAEAYRKLGMYQEAIDLLREGIAKHPTYPLGYLGLASCYYDKEQFNLAYQTLRPLITEHRENIRMQRLFARTCEKLDKRDEALDTYKHLLFFNPKESSLAKKVSELEKNIPSVIEEDSYKEEKLDVEKNRDEDSWSMLNLRSEQHQPVEESHDWVITQNLESDEELNEIDDDSIDDFVDKPASIDPPLVTLTLVDLYMGQGHTEKALEITEKLLELNPGNSNIQDKKKEILVAMGLTPKDEGHQGLMEFYDKKIQGKGIKIDEVSQKYEEFLRMIKTRSQEVLAHL